MLVVSGFRRKLLKLVRREDQLTDVGGGGGDRDSEFVDVHMVGSTGVFCTQHTSYVI